MSKTDQELDEAGRKSEYRPCESCGTPVKDGLHWHDFAGPQCLSNDIAANQVKILREILAELNALNKKLESISD